MTTTGFDLDMTLIDSRPGIGAVYEQLATETGVAIDTGLVTSRLGPPLEWELAHWFPDAEVPRLADRYRELYPSIAPDLVAAMPGALEAVEAARRSGRTILITAKHGPSAQLHVDRLGLAIDEVFGRAWREGKADVLRAEGANVYVGDHVHDMEAARSSGAFGVAVSTGPCSADELSGAGAGIVLDGLEQFADWFGERLAGQV
ncbi:HAD family hydrolase [Aeromicrobium wangtongii]|uniref:HAD family hydrolase n=1 Tax=Aeromicrobium wangtongii TaxID=2969247 RepID=UPI0020182314|nr:haloacid dehalogenase-like hydrolase [Aeromicrobium wangtongii]MCL3816971.1 haloacid dehalogenase-like hydrolase [Aeromicrobium wangtongii]